MQTYDSVRFEEKRVRSTIGSILYGAAAVVTIILAICLALTKLVFKAINSDPSLSQNPLTGIINDPIFRQYLAFFIITHITLALFFILCNFKSVKQWQYRTLGCVWILNAFGHFSYIEDQSIIILPCIIGVLLLTPMMLSMSNRVLYFLRPISIIKSPLPVAAPQVIAMMSPMMSPMVSPQMVPMAYPTMSPHAAYATPPSGMYPPGTYPPGTYTSPNYR